MTACLASVSWRRSRFLQVILQLETRRKLFLRATELHATPILPAAKARSVVFCALTKVAHTDVMGLVPEASNRGSFRWIGGIRLATKREVDNTATKIVSPATQGAVCGAPMAKLPNVRRPFELKRSCKWPSPNSRTRSENTTCESTSIATEKIFRLPQQATLIAK